MRRDREFRRRSRSPHRRSDRYDERHAHGSRAGWEQSRSKSPNDKRRTASNAVDPKNLQYSSRACSSFSKSTNAHIAEIFDMDNKEISEKKLEEEMKRRRENIERWRAAEKAAKMGATASSSGGQNQQVAADADLDSTEKPPKKKTWSLEEEDDVEEEVEAVNVQKPTLEEEDALDAYMQGINQQVRSLQRGKKGAMHRTPFVSDAADNGKAASPAFSCSTEATPSGTKKATVVIVTRVATQQQHQMGQERRGDLIEQNADAMEYSDEEKDKDSDLSTISLAGKAKILPLTDHAKVHYRPFQKDFYWETPELAKMTNEEVEAYRLELEGIRVRGKNCPKPVKNWAQTGCSRVVLDALKKFNYEKPTPIQAQAIPAVLSGRDVIGIAKTGSGKTLAFLVPMLRHVLHQHPLEDMDGPIALIMTPTRELAMQIWKECKKFARLVGRRVVCVYGGNAISDQIAELKRGAEIIVCTPGRMIDVLAANNGAVTNLRRVTFLVLDEADRMFDMGFEPQVTKIVSNIRPDRQTVMFSATFPRQMEALARKVLLKPIEIQVGVRSVVCKDVEQHVVVVQDHEKFFKLLELLGVYYESGNVLVFVDKQERADEVVKDLMSHRYFLCAPLHGAIDQVDRSSTIDNFKSGKVKVLVATSVAARGLDVPNLILVVNYDCPNHYEDYVHRVGRTGRAGNKGFAYTFLLPEGQERQAGDLIRAFEQAQEEVPQQLQSIWDDHKAKMQVEGKTVKHGGGGFGGRGFKFNEAEAERVASKRKMEKLVLGLTNSDDEEDDIEQQIEKLMKSTTRVTEGVTQPLAFGAVNRLTAEAAAAAPANESLEKAKLLAKEINKSMNIGMNLKESSQQTAEAILKGQPTEIILTPKSIAQQKAGKLNERLNYTPVVQEAVEEQQPYTRYEEELEINDFPQQVRWRITNRETMQNIQDNVAEVGISVKGLFVPNGKEPKENERRLFLAVEATSELAINQAKAEIIRILKEEMKKLASQNSNPAHNKARYKVV